MIYLFRKWLKEGATNYLLIPMSMIFAGAIGNLIDGMFYGLIFDSGMVYDSTIDRWIGYDGISQFTNLKRLFSFYERLCSRYVSFSDVSFNLFGKHFEFFSYIFNVADSALPSVLFSYLFSKKLFLMDLNLNINFFYYINFKKFLEVFFFP